jgi:hypothetical protein
MSSLNQVVFIVLSGYTFLFSFHGSRYFHQRLHHQRIFFHSVIAGVFIGLITLFFRQFLAYKYPDCLIFLWNSIPIEKEVLVEHKLLGRSVASIPIAYVIAQVFNFFFGWNWSICKFSWSKTPMLRWTTMKFGDDFDRLFWEVNKLESLEEKLVNVTLKNGKVYIGWFKELSKPLNNSHTSVFPLMSGYRETETKKMWLLTDYFSAYQKKQALKGVELSQDELIEQFVEVRILKEEILTINRFSIDLFDAFNQEGDASESDNKDLDEE